MTTKLLSSSYLPLFPNTKPCSQLSSSSGVTGLKKPNGIAQATRVSLSSGTFRVRAMAAVCTPAKNSPAGSFYELLGIPETVSISEIKKAYKQLARKYHPDVSPSDCSEEYTQRFILVKEAYETLSNPQTKALYDMDLARGSQLNFSSRRRRRYESMNAEEEEWQRRWQGQLDQLIMQRSMQKESGSGRTKSKSTRGNPTRRKRNSVFDLGF